MWLPLSLLVALCYHNNALYTGEDGPEEANWMGYGHSITPEEAQGITWVSVESLGIQGRAFTDTKSYYNRLPAAAEKVVRRPIWDLQMDSAGMFIQFETDAHQIYLNYTLRSRDLDMWHFPSTGVSGFDLYIYDETVEKFRWVSTNRPKYPGQLLRMVDRTESQPKVHRCRLHLPLYNAPVVLQLGYQYGTYLKKDPNYKPGKPVIWYGTSILQGAVASRPGEATTNIVARELNMEIYNFGFSGNCLMEETVVEWLVQIHDPSLFIIDCSWNMTPQQVHNRTVPLVKFIRSKLPNIPIILAEGTPGGMAWWNVGTREYIDEKRTYLRDGYNQLKKDGMTGLYYVDGQDLYDNRNQLDIDPTVGGTHPSDLGQQWCAKYYIARIPQILKHFEDTPQPNNRQPPQLSPEDHQALREPVYEEKAKAVLGSGHNSGTPPKDTQWTKMQKLEVGGKGFPASKTQNFFDRLPKAAEGVVRNEVWSLSKYSTGVYIRFHTNSSYIAINAQLYKPAYSLWHMDWVATSGVDLMQWDMNAKTWRHINSACGDKDKSTLNFVIAQDLNNHTATMATYLLYLPLRNSLNDDAMIGVDPAALIGSGGEMDVAPVFNNNVILWYGTSIQQGGVASRTAHEYDAFISRNISREILNFGFAGNGKMEVNVTEFLVQVTQQISVFIIDCLPNLNAEEVTKRTVPVVKYVRKYVKDDIPLILVENTPYPEEWYELNVNSSRAAKNTALRTQYDRLVKMGYGKNLLYVTGDQLFSRAGTITDSLVNPTVGGTHPSDLGQWAMASFWSEYLGKLLG